MNDEMNDDNRRSSRSLSPLQYHHKFASFPFICSRIASVLRSINNNFGIENVKFAWVDSHTFNAWMPWEMGFYERWKCFDHLSKQLTIKRLRLTRSVTAFLFSENNVSASSFVDTSRPLTFPFDNSICRFVFLWQQDGRPSSQVHCVQIKMGNKRANKSFC